MKYVMVRRILRRLRNTEQHRCALCGRVFMEGVEVVSKRKRHRSKRWHAACYEKLVRK